MCSITVLRWCAIGTQNNLDKFSCASSLCSVGAYTSTFHGTFSLPVRKKRSEGTKYVITAIWMHVPYTVNPSHKMVVALWFALLLGRAASELINITFLNTNDMQGNVVQVGGNFGFPALSGALKQFQRPLPIFDPGNYLGFTNFLDYYNASVQGPLMAQMGYKYVGLGKQEFTFNGPLQLASFLKASNVTVVCSNCDPGPVLAPFFRKYVVTTVIDNDGFERKVGIVGYTVENLCMLELCEGSISVSAVVPAVSADVILIMTCFIFLFVGFLHSCSVPNRLLTASHA